MLGGQQKIFFVKFRNLYVEQNSSVQILKVSILITVVSKLNLYCSKVEISVDDIKERIG